MASMKFHITDILSILSNHMVSLPECSPIGPDGPLPPRQLPIEGTLQIAEYVTGDKVPRRISPETGRLQFDGVKAIQVMDTAGKILQQQHPELRQLDEAVLPAMKGVPKDRQLNVMRAAREAIEARYGAYVEVQEATVEQKAAMRKGDMRPDRN